MAMLPPGFGVLVTRPAGQADTLCRLIEDGGGRAIRLPLLDIAPTEADAEGPRRLRQSQSQDWLVFVSANAVRCAFELLGPQWLEGSQAKIAAVGLATARALADRGSKVDLKPKQQFNSEALLADPAWADAAGKRFLIVRGEGGRELLAETLRMRGGSVEYAEVYRRIPSTIDRDGLLERWRAGDIDAVTLTSGEALDRLTRLMAGGGEELFAQTPMVVIGERLAIQAREAGCVQVVAAEASDTDIFNAVARIGQALIKTHQPRG